MASSIRVRLDIDAAIGLQFLRDSSSLCSHNLDHSRFRHGFTNYAKKVVTVKSADLVRQLLLKPTVTRDSQANPNLSKLEFSM